MERTLADKVYQDYMRKARMELPGISFDNAPLFLKKTLFEMVTNGRDSLSDDDLSRVFISTLSCQQVTEFYYKKEAEFLEKLRNTEEYKVCLREYNIFITELANLIKKLNLKNTKEIFLVLDSIMKNGMVSENMHHNYYIDDSADELFSELSGAKVLTGKSVCRHMSTFYMDVLNGMGLQAMNIVCYTDSDRNTKDNSNNVKCNHVVVGVMDNGKVLGYDPTNTAFLTSIGNSTLIDGSTVSLVGFANKKVILCNPVVDVKNDMEIVNKMMGRPIEKVSENEIEFLYKKLKPLLLSFAREIIRFRCMQSKRLSIISKYERELELTEGNGDAFGKVLGLGIRV